MTLDEMLTDLNKRIGSTPEVPNVNMTTWINQAQRGFCAEHDFDWLEKKVTTSTVADQEDYTLPTDFKNIVEVQIDGSTAKPTPYRYTSHEMRVLESNTNKTFSIFNGVMKMHPAPTSTGLNNLEMWYIKKPVDLSAGSDSPSDDSKASMPEEFHEALVIYAFSVYNTYDEEHDEARALMGSQRSNMPGTYHYIVNLAIRDSEKRKRGQRTKIIQNKRLFGYVHPNRTTSSTTVLGN
ncbi:MAG: hypothetical protein DRP09_10910 [Candidatus Thorarchaeota archaeon]|nr:MAG: hypothetical protein DRP09_10910 [Candidatus Thorarchaeota archaeon]